jgi:hypothetical protein
MKIILSTGLPTQETENLVVWLLQGDFLQPDFSWSALSVGLKSSGTSWHYGGYYYDELGQWSVARIRRHAFNSEDDLKNRAITSAWNQAVRQQVMDWRAALMHVVRDGDVLRVSVALDRDMERWSGGTHGSALPDVIRPPGLPVPPGPNTRRPDPPAEAANQAG